MNKKNQKVIDYMIDHIKIKGYKSDKYGNWKDKTGEYRYNFNATSYRFEKKIDSKWYKLSGTYYKNVQIKAQNHDSN